MTGVACAAAARCRDGPLAIEGGARKLLKPDKNDRGKPGASFTKTHREKTQMSQRDHERGGVSRRALLQVGAGLAGGAMLPAAFTTPTFAVGVAEHPPLGTWPAGSAGPSVSIGAAVPRTGAYAVQGEDELKGMQLAVEHINAGHPLIKKIAPKITKGVLGKQVNLVVADSARQAERRGAGAAALHQREQDRRHDRLDLVGGGGGAQQVRRAREGPLPGRRSPARTTPPARTACATASASASTARPRPMPSARSCSRRSARTRRRRS